jgi:hypothetical protein
MYFIIYREYPCKNSGYFWVKNKCADKAARVYCDFKTANGNFYTFIGKFNSNDPPLENVIFFYKFRLIQFMM